MYIGIYVYVYKQFLQYIFFTNNGIGGWGWGWGGGGEKKSRYFRYGVVKYYTL